MSDEPELDIEKEVIYSFTYIAKSEGIFGADRGVNGMVDKAIVKSIQEYLKYVEQQGIPVSYGVLFGSYAKNKSHEWSDIDVLVVSPHFDESQSVDEHEKLWMLPLAPISVSNLSLLARSSIKKMMLV